MSHIDGNIAVVTGGTQGLGALVARKFASAGAAATAIVGRNASKGQRVADSSMADTGMAVQMFPADLAKIEDVREIILAEDAKFEKIDILVNSASLTDCGNWPNTSPALFDEKCAR